MFCNKCGNKLTDDDDFCPKCGAPAKRGNGEQAVREAEETIKRNDDDDTGADVQEGKTYSFTYKMTGSIPDELSLEGLRAHAEEMSEKPGSEGSRARIRSMPVQVEEEKTENISRSNMPDPDRILKHLSDLCNIEASKVYAATTADMLRDYMPTLGIPDAELAVSRPRRSEFKEEHGCMYTAIKIISLIVLVYTLIMIIIDISQSGLHEVLSKGVIELFEEIGYDIGGFLWFCVLMTAGFFMLIVEPLVVTVKYLSALKTYRLLVAEDKQRCEYETRKFREVEGFAHKCDEIIASLDRAGQVIYSKYLPIHQSYHNYRALRRFKEYFETGRTTGFGGADGAYSIYENEIRQSRQVDVNELTKEVGNIARMLFVEIKLAVDDPDNIKPAREFQKFYDAMMLVSRNVH